MSSQNEWATLFYSEQGQGWQFTVSDNSDSDSDEDEEDEDGDNDENSVPGTLKFSSSGSAASPSITLCPSDTEELQGIGGDSDASSGGITIGPDDEPDPTHECSCGDQRAIESAPGPEYSWCESCEKVQRHTRIKDDSDG